jgi:hypothetical protein
MFMPKILRGEALEPGISDVVGLESVLTMEEWGPDLEVPGAAITPENVDDTGFWDDLTAPADPVSVVESSAHPNRQRSGDANSRPKGSVHSANRRMQAEKPAVSSAAAGRLSPKLVDLALDHLVWGILVVCSLTIDRFFQVGILLNFLQHATFVGILAVGLAFCIIAGHMDLSVESVMAFSAMLGASPVSSPASGCSRPSTPRST